MTCPQHPKYNPSRPLGKRNANCPNCLLAKTEHDKVQKQKQKERKQYVSLTTPGYECELAHLVAEISTLSLFGLQPAYFWRKDIACDDGAKEHFFSIIKEFKHYSNQNFNDIKVLSRIFYMFIFGKRMQKAAKNTSVVVEVTNAPKEEVTKQVFEIITPPKKDEYGDIF